MAISPNINNLEKDKFRGTSNTDTKVAVTLEQDDTAGANTSGTTVVLDVGTTAVLACVGVSNMPDRKVVILEAKTANVRWSFDPAFSAADGYRLFTNTVESIPVGDNINVYLLATTSSNDVTVSEVV